MWTTTTQTAVSFEILFDNNNVFSSFFFFFLYFKSKRLLLGTELFLRVNLNKSDWVLEHWMIRMIFCLFSSVFVDFVVHFRIDSDCLIHSFNHWLTDWCVCSRHFVGIRLQYYDIHGTPDEIYVSFSFSFFQLSLSFSQVFNHHFFFFLSLFLCLSNFQFNSSMSFHSLNWFIDSHSKQ